MFSPALKRASLSSRKDRNLSHSIAVSGSPATPAADNQKSAYGDNCVPDRPSTGTPAPWAPRLSVLARISPASKGEKGDDIDPTKPVFVGEFPQLVRDEQSRFWRNRLPGDACVSGGLDKETCLAWFFCESKLFIWSYLTTMSTRKCVALELPFSVLGTGDSGSVLQDRKSWLINIVSWDTSDGTANRVGRSCISAGVVMCNKKTQAIVYWPDIFSGGEAGPVTSFASGETESYSSPVARKSSPFRQQQSSGLRSSGEGLNDFNSFITTAVSTSEHVCVALACSSNGELWQFTCSPTSINSNQVRLHSFPSEIKGYPRSLIWRFPQLLVRESSRQFFMLTDSEIQCFSVEPYPCLSVSKVWHHEIVGTDGDLGIKKDLASQKQIWPLDVQVDDQGKVITILVATICMDRASSSSYTQYSLLTMQHKSETKIADSGEARILEKKAPIQVIVPKARVENEGFLFSMRLRVGGRPPGSAIVLSGDGTATVSYCYGNSTRLYKFDLPYDAGKVLDASILPSTDKLEYGAWVVLTEKAGVWAIPEKAIILGGVEPPERSLSRKGSSNERSSPEEAKNMSFGGNVDARWASSDLLSSGDKEKGIMSGITRRTVRDEESEALLGQLFEFFLLSGNVDGSLEKLQNSGAFDRDGETSVFTRKSKSIVDTLAKHWTTTRGPEIVAMGIISAQLVEKQQKHEKFLHFLALSKCHEELCSKQRHSLQIILEHGEKLAAMVELRELQSLINQSHSAEFGQLHPSTEAVSSALWDVIQIVGERTRRNTVLLMDRDNAEVFYSKVSELEDVFYCLDRQLEYILSPEQQLRILVQRACELSNVCVTIIQTAMEYRNEHQMWYPPFEGLTPWHSQLVVRNGLWHIASFMLQLLTEASGLDMSAKSDVYMHLKVLTGVLLEAYTGATTAKIERGEENKGLLDEYWTQRDTLFDCLFQQAKEFAEAGYQDIKERVENTDEDIFRKLCSDLLPIAKLHEGYKVMWRICYDLNDTALLRNLMHESMGPQGGFSYFVFKQLYDMKQFSKLLRLGEEFQEELLIFLKRHRDLLWLHEVFLHQFLPASDTLHALALAQDEQFIATTGERTVTEPENPKQILADRKRLLNLSKIAVMADKDADSKSKVERIEADLNLLKLQEEITKAFPSNEEIRRRLVRPEELIELCLRNKGLTLKAFDVFAWTSSSFRKSHVVLLEDCWRNAADQDNWVEELHQASASEGWTDEKTLQRLRDTVLFQASNRCYGHQAKTIDGGFEDILPLRQESLPVLKDSSSTPSVEAILMQHKDFAEAGKLMLTAIMLGCVEDEVDAEEHQPSPME